MNYNKYDMGPYNLHIIKTKKYKTVTIRVNFKEPAKKIETSYRSILAHLLVESTNKYPNQRNLAIAIEDLYNLKLSFGTNVIGNYNIMSFNFQFLNELYTEKNMLKKSVQFITNVLMEPNIENNSFKKPKLENVQQKLIDTLKISKSQPNYYASKRLFEIIDKEAPFSNEKLGDIDIIEKTNGHDLYNYYKKVIKGNLIDIFIVGDVDNELVKQIFTENFKINTLKKPGESHIYNHKKFRKRARYIKEEYDSKQSQLMVGAKIEPLNNFERQYVAVIYSYILGGSTDSLLFNKLREKNSLSYSVYSLVLVVSNLLIIGAGIDKLNYEKAINIIRREIRNIKKGNFSDELIENAKTTYLNDLEKLTDSPITVLKYYAEMEYLNTNEINIRKESIKKVSKQMIIDFAKKIQLDTIFLLEGVL